MVYGMITVGALLDAESAYAETYGETVAAIAIAMLLVWLAHSYAKLTGRRFDKREPLTVSGIWDTAAHELGILTGAAIPLLAVLIAWAASARLGDAVSAGIWTAAAVLVLIELIAGLRAKLSGKGLAIQVAFGSLLGVLVIAIKIILH
jgi:hypothetical protein